MAAVLRPAAQDEAQETQDVEELSEHGYHGNPMPDVLVLYYSATGSVRELAQSVAQSYYESRERLGFPMLRQAAS